MPLAPPLLWVPPPQSQWGAGGALLCFSSRHRGFLTEKESSKVCGAKGTAQQVGMGGTPCFKGEMTSPAGDRQDGKLCRLSSLELCAGPLETLVIWFLILFGLSSSMQFFLHFTVLKLFFLSLSMVLQTMYKKLWKQQSWELRVCNFCLFKFP